MDASRYKTDGASIVRVRCGCGHFDTILLKVGEFITIDGTFDLCVVCQAAPIITGEALQDRRDLG